MAIEALYPSRRQSQRRNPLFARERRLHRIGLVVGVGVSVIGFLGLRSGPSGTSAEAMGLGSGAVHGTLVAPFAPRGIAHKASTSGAPAIGEHKKHVRVIPLFHIPADAAVLAPDGGEQRRG